MLRSLIFHLQNHCLQLHVDVEKTLLWSSACTQESTMQELLGLVPRLHPLRCILARERAWYIISRERSLISK